MNQRPADPYAIADRAVICDIETECLAVTEAGQRWYDTRVMLDPREHDEAVVDMMRESLAYADARKLIARHPESSYLVRIIRTTGGAA